MRILLRGLRGIVWMVVACMAASPVAAASPSEFYLTMMRRGVSAHDAGRFDTAASMLRIAAFGFLDSVEHYQTAQMYLALSYDRLGDADRARDAARKVVTAERLERRYASLSVPAATRANFDALAKRALTAAEAAVLSRAPESVPQSVSVPKAEPPKVEPVKAAAQPPQSKAPAAQPPRTETKQPSNPATQQPKTITNAPAPQPKPPATPTPQPRNPATPTINVPSRFAEAERLLTAARLPEARAIYRELLDKATLQHTDLLRLAEGFYRSRDFANVLRAFERIGQLRRGEEPYRYYIAVALYETGQYRRAKEELAAVLPYIEVTPDVERYRSKIQASAN